MADTVKNMLRCNGVPILLSAASPPVASYDEIGAVNDRSIRGTLLPSRRNVTRVLTAKTAPYTLPDAQALWALVEGAGAASSLDATGYPLNRALNGVASGSGSASITTGFYMSPPGALLTNGAYTLTWSNLYIGQWLASALGCTINFWMRHTANGNFTLASLSKAGASDGGLTITRGGAGQLTFTYPSVATLLYPFWYADFNWHMITAVARDTTLSRYPTASLYVDGVPVATGGAAGTAFAYPARDVLAIGPTVAGVPLWMDDLVVYPFPLNDAQVAGLYTSQCNAGAAPREQQTARYLPQVWVSGDGIGDAMLAVGKVTGTQVLATHRDPVTGELLTNSMTLDLQFSEAGAPR